MGLIGRTGDPKVLETVEATLKRIIAAGRTAGTFLVGNQNAERYASIGVRFLHAGIQPWLAAGGRPPAPDRQPPAGLADQGLESLMPSETRIRCFVDFERDGKQVAHLQLPHSSNVSAYGWIGS